jgi:iron complex transport system ATP-binding protein
MAALMDAKDLTLPGLAKPRLSDVGMNLAAGEIVGIVGPNGAGKSSLLAVLAGVQTGWGGSVTVSDRDIRQWDRIALARIVSYLPQDFRCQWAFTVENLIGLGASRGQAFGQHFGWGGATAAREAEWVYDAFDLALLRHRPFHLLSGGEQARAALAAAIAAQPSALLADEPIANLDPYHQLDALRHLKRLAEGGMAVAIAMHDLTLAARFCDRLILMDGGRVVTAGPPDVVLTVERLAAIYRIKAVLGMHDGEPYVVPWTRAGE